VISLTPLIQHLTPKPVGFARLWFRRVDGAAEYAKIQPEALPLPAAWVVRSADKETDAGERAANLTLGFDVVIAIENARSHYPGETDDIMLNYRYAVRKLLQGWEVEPNVRPVKFKGGRVLDVTNKDLYWADHYEFDALITNYLPDPVPFSELVYTGETL